MYNNGALASTGALAASSMIMQSVWLFLAGFALLAAGVAVTRILPRPTFSATGAHRKAGRAVWRKRNNGR